MGKKTREELLVELDIIIAASESRGEAIDERVEQAIADAPDVNYVRKVGEIDERPPYSGETLHNLTPGEKLPKGKYQYPGGSVKID